MDLTPDPLSDKERARLRAAIASGRMERKTHDWKKWDREGLEEPGMPKVEAIAVGLRRLLRVWEGLPERARETVLQDVGHKIDAKLIRYGAFEEAIRERLELIAYRRPPKIPGLYEAVIELRSIWEARGNQTGGNAYRSEGEGREMHLMHEFIGKHVLASLPDVGGDTLGTKQRLRRAITQVETQLRKLRDVPPEYR